MKLRLHSLCFAPSIFSRRRSSHYSQGFHFTSSCEEIAVTNDVLNIIEKTSPMEPVLEKVVPFLTPEIVASILDLKKHDPVLGFRFFIWAARRKRFRSWASHDTVIDMLVRDDVINSDSFSSRFELYWRILGEVKESGGYICSDAFAVLISGYWKLKKADKAVETFGKMREFDCQPGLFTYNMILHVMIRKDVVLLAMAVYNLMLKANSPLNSSTFSILIDGLCKGGKTEDALKLFDEMSERSILPSKITYAVIMSGLCEAKRENDAYKLFISMKSRGRKPDSAIYNVLLNGFCKVGRIDEAFVLFKSFKDDGYVLGMKGYSCIIDGLIRASRIDEALAMFQQLFQIDVIPDVVLYTIMIRGLCLQGKVNDALNLLRDMTQRGVAPDTCCYNSLIKGFCDKGILDRARSLHLEISTSDLFPDTCTYTILISGMCKNGLLGEAKQIFDEIEKHGCSPSVVTFNTLIDGLWKAGELEEACLMFYKMEIGRKPSLFLRLSQGEDRVLDTAGLQRVVEKLCESGLVLKAYKLLMQLADSGVVPDVVTYNILINALCKAGNVNGALKLFEELQLKGHAPDKITYGTLLDGLMRVGRDEDAFKFFEQMKHRGMRGPEVYKSLMTWCCRKRNTALAFGVWLQYMEDICGVTNENVNLVGKHFKAGNTEFAIKELLHLNLKWRSFDSAPYNIWLIGLCQANRTEDALRHFSLLKEHHIDVSCPSYVKLIQRLCCDGDLDQAASIFLHSVKKDLRLMPEICNKLLTLLLNSKKKAKDAFYILEQMKSVGYDIDSHLYHSTKSLFESALKVQEIEAVLHG